MFDRVKSVKNLPLVPSRCEDLTSLSHVVVHLTWCFMILCFILHFHVQFMDVIIHASCHDTWRLTRFGNFVLWLVATNHVNLV